MAALVVIGGGALYWGLSRPEPAPQGAGAETAGAETAVASGTAEAATQSDLAQTGAIEDMQIGNPDAPVTVIEYASYTCPHCASFHSNSFKQLKTDYIDSGKINFIYREVYFDRYGLWASMIARCAGPDKFFGMTDLIYKGQSQWARAGEPGAIIDELRKLGRLAGLDGDQLESCLQDEDKARELVEWYQKNAETHGIDSTPSFVINGTTYTNMAYPEMSKIIDEAAK
jgi:protein-disulfide isomerase